MRSRAAFALALIDSSKADHQARPELNATDLLQISSVNLVRLGDLDKMCGEGASGRHPR